MSEVSIVAQKVWLIISAFIIGTISVGAIAVIAWWFITNFSIYAKSIREEPTNSRNSYAAIADAGWSNYLNMKERYDFVVMEYERTLAKKDQKIELMEEWDLQRMKRISQLEKQLTDNGIEPNKLEFVA